MHAFFKAIKLNAINCPTFSKLSIPYK